MIQWLQCALINCLPVRPLRRWAVANAGKAERHAAFPATCRNLLIDVSVISVDDAGTGIQRAVRNLYQELLAQPPAGYQVCPVAATRHSRFAYLAPDFLQTDKIPSGATAMPTGSVEVRPGDLFLGLDYAAHIIPTRIIELLRWKRAGVKMCFVVYDLLPIQEPSWFTPRASRNYRRWYRTIAVLADRFITISKSVRDDFSSRLESDFALGQLELPCKAIQLGADFDASCSSTDEHIESVRSRLPARILQEHFILMVGTIEPRKAHGEVLDAFERLWAGGANTMLVIAGKQGWKVEQLISRLQSHPEHGKRLLWLNNPDDDVLRALYLRTQGVIMASKGEGLGLPLLEAARFKKPILARDIPVFREIAGEAASYFSGIGASGLAETLPKWLMSLEAPRHDPAKSPSFVSWQVSRNQLVSALLLV